MSRTGRCTGLLATAAMAMPVAACTAGGGGGGDGEASCADLCTYQAASYTGLGPNVKFTLGKKLGVATQTGCDDTGRGESEDPVRTETVYEVDGISPEDAIAIGDTPKTATLFAVYSGKEAPPEVRKLIEAS